MPRNLKTLLLTFLLGISFIVPSFAASLTTGYDKKTATIGMPDYGFTTFNITAKLTETYEKEPTRVKYSGCQVYIVVTASRYDSGIKLDVAPVPRYYDRSTNKTVKTLTMYNSSVILPGNYYAAYCKHNSDVVYYTASNNYACGLGFALFATGCINPFGDSLSVNLKV